MAEPQSQESIDLGRRIAHIKRVLTSKHSTPIPFSSAEPDQNSSPPDCPACAEYRKLIHGAAQKIQQYRSKFRAVESSLDGEEYFALRRVQSMETVCREDYANATPDLDRLKEMAEHAKAVPLNKRAAPMTDIQSQETPMCERAVMGYFGSGQGRNPGTVEAASDSEPLEDFEDLEMGDGEDMGLDSSSVGSETGSANGSGTGSGLG